MTHRRFTLVSAFELQAQTSNRLVRYIIVDDETKTMHPTQQYKINDRTTREQ
jgi:hypothetical protein